MRLAGVSIAAVTITLGVPGTALALADPPVVPCCRSGPVRENVYRDAREAWPAAPVDRLFRPMTTVDELLTESVDPTTQNSGKAWRRNTIVGAAIGGLVGAAWAVVVMRRENVIGDPVIIVGYSTALGAAVGSSAASCGPRCASRCRPSPPSTFYSTLRLQTGLWNALACRRSREDRCH